MREFVFTVAYEAGVDAVMDLFIEHPDLYATSVACHVTSEAMWRLDRVRGPEAALDELEARLSRLRWYDEVVTRSDCPEVQREHEILSRSPTDRLLYSRRREADHHQSIPFVAARHVGDGLLCRTERRGDEYVWRLLVDDDDAVAGIVADLEAGLRDGVHLDVRRLSEPADWTGDRPDAAELPPEQRAALETAVEYGYYEMPRRHSALEIADDLGLSHSTFQYRLRRAEAWLARGFAARSPGLDAPDAATETSSTD